VRKDKKAREKERRKQVSIPLPPDLNRCASLHLYLCTFQKCRIAFLSLYMSNVFSCEKRSCIVVICNAWTYGEAFREIGAVSEHAPGLYYVIVSYPIYEYIDWQGHIAVNKAL